MAFTSWGMPQTSRRTRRGEPSWTRWRKKTKLATPSRLFARATPMQSNLSLSRGNYLRFVLKVAASDNANIACRVDTYVPQWYVIFRIHITRSSIKASQCHADQDNHRRMKCNQPCVRVTCARAHPCPRLCFEDCGDCEFPVYGVKLPCGHVAKSVPWQVLSDFALVRF